MGKHLKAEQLEKIVEIITEWDGKITWNDILDISEEVTGHRFSRPALNAHDDILTAYQANQTADHDARRKQKGRRPKSQALLAAEARIEKLKARNEYLQKINDQLNEKFLIWLSNAVKKNLTETDLEGTGRLSTIDRGRTED